MNSLFEHAIFTDRGTREVNEDSVGVFESSESTCYVLCDGLGGHGMGEVASALVVDCFKKSFADIKDAPGFLGETISSAQEALRAEQQARRAKRKMKTTCVSLLTDKSNAYIAHVGDSRLYVFNKNKIFKRTLDHSIPQMLVFSKEIKESQIRNHPDRNVLLRVMGIDWEEDMYEVMSPIPQKKCQAFLLCSDGFWELIEENDMCSSLKKASSAEEWLSMMLETVKANGEGRDMDNFSAIAVLKKRKKG